MTDDLWRAAWRLVKAYDRAERKGQADRIPRRLEKAVAEFEVRVLELGPRR